MLLDICGTIDRRILVNYRIDPGVLAAKLPDPFRPQTMSGYGIGGICLIRLRNLRPRGMPSYVGVSSENAAHRIAVEWDENGERRMGVYVPRRDTNSRLNTVLGGSLFPGIFNPASFEVQESDDRFEVSMASKDDDTRTQVTGVRTDSLPDDSVFESVQSASAFFERGSVGYSPIEQIGEYDAMDLRIPDWEVTPFSVESLESSYFEDFPAETAVFDNALLMEDTYHEWREGDPIASNIPARSTTARPDSGSN